MGGTDLSAPGRPEAAGAAAVAKAQTPNSETGARFVLAVELADTFRATRIVGHIFGAHLGAKSC
jgi:hypothetical protein